MKPSRSLLLLAIAGVVAACGGNAASQVAFNSRFAQCGPRGQAVYDYLRSGVDSSGDHNLDVGFADQRASILKQPDTAQDGLMRAAAQKQVTACEQAAAPSLAIPVGPGVTSDTITLGLITDLSGIHQRHQIGVDRIMWSTDFPHHGNDWPRSRWTIDQQFAGVSAEDRERIVCRNAVELFGLERPAASRTATAKEPAGVSS